MAGDGTEEMSTIPGFNQIQFEGFCRFIDRGLTEEFSKFPKIEDTDQEIEFQLFVETYQLVEPLIKERDAVYESLTYSSELYVSAGLIWKTSRDMQEQTIFIGNIPLMNSLGTSIVNGIYRIVINQILQSPGIYYRSELDHNGISVYTGTIISDWGGRLELEIDRKARIWARVSRKQKISILVLSSAMGSSLREILENVCYPEIFLSFLNDKEKKKIKSKENAILEFYQQFACVGGDPVFSESLCKEVQKKFFQQRCELGRIGRRNMNRRLNLDIPQNNTFLLPRDILAAADHLIGMKFGMGTLDDMNHLKNKRIRSVADLLQDQFGLALVRLENMVRGTICGAIRHKLIPTPQNLVTSTPLTTTYESFFGLHPLSQVLDRTNPLTQIVHGRKLSYLGPGGLTGRTASFRIRDIHPSHYGRICPIDTSEGINVGLIGSLAIHARCGHWGSLESPFYEISERSKKVRMLYLSPSRDEYYMVAAGNSLALNRGIQEEQVVPARYRQEFLTIEWEEVHLRSIFPFQYFSIGASLIPFIEHNDANRALMSSNMQRQAVPLSRSEKCIVGTGLERQVALDSGVLAIAEHEGKIIIPILTRSFYQAMGILKAFHEGYINVRTKILVCIKKPKLREVNVLKRDKFKRMVLLPLAANSLWEKTYKKLICHGKVTILRMRYSLMSVWYMRIFILLFTYGNMKFRLMKQVTVLKESLMKYRIEKPIYSEIKTKKELRCWGLGWRRVIFKKVNKRPRWRKNHRMLRKIDYYEPSLAFRYPLQRKLVKSYLSAVEVELLMGDGSRKKGVLVIIQKRFVYIFHKNVKLKWGIKELEDMEIRVSFQKFYLDKICLICKMEDPLIWSSTHKEYPHARMKARYLNALSGWREVCKIDIIEKHLLMRDMNKRLRENKSFLNYMKPVSKQRIHGYLNPSIREKAEYLMEERGILLNNLLKKESLISGNEFIKLMIKYMDVLADIMHLLHNNHLEEGPSRGGSGKEKWKFGLERDLVLLIFYKRCLLINLIILELAKKYLVLQSLEEQYLNRRMLQNLFDCSFENYDLWLWNRIISLYLRKTSRLIGRTL
nr:RNA polymerase beta subunit [Ziziphus hajarensis]